MSNTQLKLGAFGQNTYSFEKDYRGQAEEKQRQQGSLLPEIKNYGASGSYVNNSERLDGVGKEGFGVSRYEFLRNINRIEYPAQLIPQIPIHLAKEQIRALTKMLFKDYSAIRNSFLATDVKRQELNDVLRKVRGFPSPLVAIADSLVEERISSYGEDEMVNPEDYDFIDEIEAYLESQESGNVSLSGMGVSQYDPLVREMAMREEASIPMMEGEGGDVEDIVASDDSVPMRMAGLVPQSMDALSTHRGKPVRPERRSYLNLLTTTPSDIDMETVNSLTSTERTNLRKAYRNKQKEVPKNLIPQREPRPTAGRPSRAMEAQAGGLTEEQEQLMRQMRE
jgi:hypothetical protein